MNLSDFNYAYPEELVAQQPLSERDASRMMIIDRVGKTCSHSKIGDLPSHLKSGDLLIINDTKVFPARLIGRGESGGKIELLLLNEIDPAENIWEVISTRKKRLKEGTEIRFNDELSAKIIKINDAYVTARFSMQKQGPDKRSFQNILEKIGLPPLPPYIRRNGKEDYTDLDRERYQTVYARERGSAAAPTAGFHITEDAMAKCRAKGVGIAPVTLHIGLDTFLPVRTGNILNHKIHGEKYQIPEETVQKMEEAKERGGRIIAVGTTSVRALESYATTKQRHGTTTLFIHPGYHFKATDGILTNFHQPKSTLLMLVSAFAGREFTLQMYSVAIRERYRLFSYGDCMLIS